MPKLSKQSVSKQRGGVWLEWEGIRFLIARLNNPKVLEARDAWASENRARKEAGKSALSFDEAWLDILSSAVLLGWEGLDGDDDQPLPYSPREARKILSDPAYSDFRAWVESSAATREHYLEAADKAAEKNSSALSPQSSTSAETSAGH